MNLKIDVKQQEKFVLVKVAGEIDVYTTQQLREKVFFYSEQSGIHLIIDLAEVSYMDSTGLGVLVGIFKNIRITNGKFQLVGLSERLIRLFEITGLNDIMDINSEIEGGVQ